LTKAFFFCRERRLLCCNDPESYAGGSVATGRVTLAGQVKGEHPDNERYSGPPGWGLGVLLVTAHRKKSIAAKVQQGYSGETKGRQNRRRWMDQVEEDLKRMKITGWRVKAEDRKEWSRIAEQTKTHPGL
jgi:hypothetical protein